MGDQLLSRETTKSGEANPDSRIRYAKCEAQHAAPLHRRVVASWLEIVWNSTRKLWGGNPTAPSAVGFFRCVYLLAKSRRAAVKSAWSWRRSRRVDLILSTSARIS